MTVYFTASVNQTAKLAASGAGQNQFKPDPEPVFALPFSPEETRCQSFKTFFLFVTDARCYKTFYRRN
jgi:hypothetical protein